MAERRLFPDKTEEVERETVRIMAEGWRCSEAFARHHIAADQAVERLRAALYEVTTNGAWTEGEQRGGWMISKEVYETARDALS